jgi:carboxypeptidase family protein/TonB-dependent receptor-like protein
MNRTISLRRVAALAASIVGLPAVVQPQGLAGAAVAGVAIRTSGKPVVGATVVLRNLSTGFTRQFRTGSNGRFVFEDVPPGGPFELRGLAIGLDSARASRAFTLALGDRIEIDVEFREQNAAVLEAVNVRADARRVDGGPSFAIPSEMIHGLPLLNRDFTALFATIPQALGAGYSISGQLPSLNAIQIDGGIANDIYGVSRTPGAAAGANSISLEVLDQIQVLVAPLDVRQGAFSGGLINGITRSGTNQWRGSVFTSFQNQALVGSDTSGAAAAGLEFVQYGGTIGGPIVRDKLLLFVAADLQQRRTRFVGADARDSSTGISWATATRAAGDFRALYGFDAGGPEPPVLRQPDRSVFAKLTWQPSSSHRVELTHNWVDASQDNFERKPHIPNVLRPGGWSLSRSVVLVTDIVHTTRLHVVSALGRFGNEIIAGVQATDENHASTLRTPLFLVQGDLAGSYLAGGSTAAATGTILNQRMAEATDNVTLPVAGHELTAGVHAEWYHFTDGLFPNSGGMWRFPSVAAFEQRQPDLYQVALPLRPGGPLGDFAAGEAAAYIQDRWTPANPISVTAGVRADRPYNDVPAQNPSLASSTVLGAGYSRRFATATQLSPRLGLSWRAADRHPVVIRVGAGMFEARAPQVWLGNEFINTGSDQETLTCAAKDGVPSVVVDVDHLPQSCTGVGSVTPIRNAAYVSRDFRSPQVWKFLAGVDAAMAWGTSVSIDAVGTDARYEMYVRDVNLAPTGTNAEGRAMYGTITAGGSVTPSRPEQALGQVLAFSSQSGDRSTALSVSAIKRWGNGSIAQVGYQWSHALDVLTLGNASALLMFQNNPIDGTIDARRQTRSWQDVPRSLSASAVANLPFMTQASFLLRVQSGRPFAYTVGGDPNADGVSANNGSSNDLFYVPRDSADISLTTPERWGELDQYIESHACLRGQRGRIVARNSCRNPAVFTLDGRLAKTVSVGGNRLEIGANIFNLPNLINHRWGFFRQATALPGLNLLTVAGWDAASNRPTYKFIDPLPADKADVNASRWQIQLGMRYWPR